MSPSPLRGRVGMGVKRRAGHFTTKLTKDTKFRMIRRQRTASALIEREALQTTVEPRPIIHEPLSVLGELGGERAYPSGMSLDACRRSPRRHPHPSPQDLSDSHFSGVDARTLLPLWEKEGPMARPWEDEGSRRPFRLVGQVSGRSRRGPCDPSSSHPASRRGPLLLPQGEKGKPASARCVNALAPQDGGVSRCYRG